MFTSKPRGGREEEGGVLKIEPLARGAAKILSLEFQYLHTQPVVILNELSLIGLGHAQNTIVVYSTEELTKRNMFIM